MNKRRKTLNVKVPKRIAGVKIPKPVRKGPVVDFLNSSGGQVLIAEALLLAAGSYAAKRVDPDSPVGEFIHHPLEKAKEAALSGKAAAHRAGKGRAEASKRLAHAFEEGMRAFRAALGEPVAAEPQSVSHLDDLIRGVAVDTTEDELSKKGARSRSRARETDVPASP
jgi:hypothetical protein